MEGISVVICCYNSALRLPVTLQYLACQELPSSLPWEIVLVNNLSTDDTATVAAATWQHCRLPGVGFTIVDQPIPGLNSAREKGIETAKYELIIFCDDDNWLDKNYLYTAAKTMEADKMIGALGGWGTAVSTGNFPDWFTQYEGGYAVGKPNFASGELPVNRYLIGAGLVFKKSVYRSAYSKYPTLLTDRQGRQLSAGGDTEFVMRLKLMGYKLYYEEALHFQHFIPPERLTSEYRDNLFKGFDTSSNILECYQLQITMRQQGIVKKGVIVLKSFIRLIAALFLKVKNWEVSKEVSLLYQYTGIEMGSLNTDEKVVRQFSQAAAKQ